MSERGDGIELLIDAVIDGQCDPAGLRQFEELVRDDPCAREMYLDQIRIHALLEWHHGRVVPSIDCAERHPSRWWGNGRLRWGLAAVAMIAVSLTTALAWLWHRDRAQSEIATLVEAREVVWGASETPIAVNERLSPRAIRWSSGTLGLEFDSGASITLVGPGDLDIVSDKRLRAVRGRITARVGGEAKGFSVETPSTRVVDQGTEFGVEVDAVGRTGVVVFQGLVDLTRPEYASGPAAVRLTQGEALRVDRTGGLSRIVAVDRQSDGAWSTEPSLDRNIVIRSVHDNVRGLASSKYYQIVHRGLYDDAQAYVDRPHEWNGLDASGLPEFLLGADYIMPFNDDKWTKDLEITVDMEQAATLFVFMDDREKTPSWLAGQFTDTRVKIGLDEGSWPDPSKFSVARGPGRSINQRFSVWKRDVEGDESITLGGLTGEFNNRSMYGVAAVARP
jgi:hypothetical protein